MRKVGFIAVVSALLLIGLMGMPAGAQTGAFVFNGTAHLNGGFPCGPACPGTFNGTARGATVLPTINCATGCAFTASYTYNEPGGQCAANVPAAPLGTANGTYTIDSISGGFSWTRVGVTAVLVLSGPVGAGVAGFVPPASCNPTNATVAGLAVVA